MWECLNHPWIYSRGPQDLRIKQGNQIHMDNLRNYQARKRWKHSMKVTDQLKTVHYSTLSAGCLPLQQAVQDQAEGEAAGGEQSPGQSCGQPCAQEEGQAARPAPGTCCSRGEQGKAGRQTGRQADRQTGRQADRQTGRQADRQTGRHADRQTGRQADRHHSWNTLYECILPYSLARKYKVPFAL